MIGMIIGILQFIVGSLFFFNGERDLGIALIIMANITISTEHILFKLRSGK